MEFEHTAQSPLFLSGNATLEIRLEKGRSLDANGAWVPVVYFEESAEEKHKLSRSQTKVERRTVFRYRTMNIANVKIIPETNLQKVDSVKK